MLPKDEAPTGSTGTLTVAQSLRDVADWLDAHPEIAATHAFVPVRAATREDLETLARALGDRAAERMAYGDDVEIEGVFGGTPDRYDGVRVYGQVPVAKLAGAPVPPKYRPILSGLDAATGEGRR